MSKDESTATSRRVEILNRRRIHEGFFKLDILELRHERFDGGWTRPMRRELFIQHPSVVILPYDPVRDLVVLVEQFRTGAVDHPGSPWLLEAPAGLVDKTGETPEQVAIREVEEETGLKVGRLAAACRYQPSPGGTSERAQVFIAEVELSSASAGVFGVAHEHEDIRTHILPAEQAFRMVEDGRIIAATGVIPLMWLRIHRERLRREWRHAAA